MNFSHVCKRQFEKFANQFTKEAFFHSCHLTESWQIDISRLKESLNPSLKKSPGDILLVFLNFFDQHMQCSSLIMVM